MKNLFKRIKYYFLSLREKTLYARLRKTIKPRFTNKTSKTIYGSGSRLILDTQTQKLGEFVNMNVKSILNKTKGDVNKLIEYVKTMKTPVYRIDKADKRLSLIHEEEGLIFEQKGVKALYLSLITGRGISFKTPPMFVLKKEPPEKLTMLYNFYLWFAMKSDMPGFDYKAQQKFKKFFANSSQQMINKLTMEDILMLKEAIARDKEATAFALEYSKATEASKKVLDKIKNEGGANI